ncbi:hypothetical protein RLOatenuis_4930 [Rickettsiales bacterium]|nr:hypothetical protein RLOatenuis_4930 [Rickettsiales bacterium]
MRIVKLLITIFIINAADCLAAVKDFPSLTSRNLNKKVISIPEDFKEEYNAVIFGFRRSQTALVEEWFDALYDIGGLDVYQIPVISSFWKTLGFAFFIDRKMYSAIKDEKKRDYVLTLYTDLKSFRASLNVEDSDVHVFLLHRDGRIMSHVQGKYNKDNYKQLLSVLH